ncbi:MAG: hypothetical protein PVJ92_00575 [Candidatus Dependentiae bacterium]|jgi:hypothetical protein
MKRLYSLLFVTLVCSTIQAPLAAFFNAEPSSVFTLQPKEEKWARRAAWGSGIAGGASLAAVAGRGLQKWYNDYGIRRLQEMLADDDHYSKSKESLQKELDRRLAERDKNHERWNKSQKFFGNAAFASLLFWLASYWSLRGRQFNNSAYRGMQSARGREVINDDSSVIDVKSALTMAREELQKWKSLERKRQDIHTKKQKYRTAVGTRTVSYKESTWVDALTDVAAMQLATTDKERGKIQRKRTRTKTVTYDPDRKEADRLKAELTQIDQQLAWAPTESNTLLHHNNDGGTDDFSITRQSLIDRLIELQNLYNARRADPVPPTTASYTPGDGGQNPLAQGNPVFGGLSQLAGRKPIRERCAPGYSHTNMGGNEDPGSPGDCSKPASGGKVSTLEKYSVAANIGPTDPLASAPLPPDDVEV